MKQDHQAEEQRLERLIAAMPDAFTYTYDGMADGNLRLSFRPNPAYNPPTYETRVYHALSGEISIQPQQKRLRNGRPHRQRDRLRLRAVGSNREGGQLPDWARAGGRETMEDDLGGRPHLGASYLLQIHQPGPACSTLGFQANAIGHQRERCGRHAERICYHRPLTCYALANLIVCRGSRAAAGLFLIPVP